MTTDERKILKALNRAHGLTFLERWQFRRLARMYGLDGRGGPSTSPAMLFFRPSFWNVFLRDATRGEDRRLRREKIEKLRGRIFGEPEMTAGAPISG